MVNGAVISATGVSGVRYKRQIELSTALSPPEKLERLLRSRRCSRSWVPAVSRIFA